MNILATSFGLRVLLNSGGFDLRRILSPERWLYAGGYLTAVRRSFPLAAKRKRLKNLELERGFEPHPQHNMAVEIPWTVRLGY